MNKQKYVFVIFGKNWVNEIVPLGKLWNVKDVNYSANWLTNSWKYSNWIYVNVYEQGTRKYVGRLTRN